MESLNRYQALLFDEASKVCEGKRELMREFLGGKGAGLADMTSAGVNVPPGLTIPTAVCRLYYDEGLRLPAKLMSEVKEKLAHVEERVGRRLGDPSNPLLVSVRSGAKFSMPGMMDTILNLGLNDDTIEGLAKSSGNARFAWDSYRRFIQMYGNVVLEISKESFEEILFDHKHKCGAASDQELSAEDWRKVAAAFRDLVRRESGAEFPQGVYEQLAGAIEAVFSSWNNERAVYYRRLHGIDDSLGTAVNVQAMVFGNLDDRSATGVCFTRNPSTGEKLLFGEYLVNAQGEDVVAGTRTPKEIDELSKEMPQVFEDLQSAVRKLESHYRDMQDIEFTIEQGKLYLLQTRNGKRTARAAIKIAVDLVGEGVLDKNEALKRIDPAQLNQILLPSFKPEQKEAAKSKGALLAVGLNASPGAAIGEVVFHSSEAERLSGEGHGVILVRPETCPDDIRGMVAAKGVATSRGGMTSHAAVVARGMGKPCVVGCESLKIDLEQQQFTVEGKVVKKGQVISLDGATGEIFLGTIPTEAPRLGDEFDTIMEWSDLAGKLGVRTNADTPEDAVRAREFGAQGIGLCRTEHMFMAPERLSAVREMIMADNAADRQRALAKILPMQKEDFAGIFRAMAGLPVTIRLLDPPLHEFLPKKEELLHEVLTLRLRKVEGPDLWQKETLLSKVTELSESNPMMGLRGCRLGLLYPEINEMQVRAIFEAAVQVQREGHQVLPEIMIPLVGHARELALARRHLEAAAINVMKESGIKIDYKFGTMIEIPRACVTADQISEYAEFFSFGTNDLTQMTFGYSRDDAEGKFLQRYVEGLEWQGRSEKILDKNPFETLDQGGVGELMRLACDKGRTKKPGLKLGICGEHGGDPESIRFAHSIGLDYVSCSPYRVPVARLAAAQAALTS